MRAALLVLAVALGLSGCAPHARSSPPPPAWDYTVDVASRGHVLHVEAAFRYVGTNRLWLDENAVAHVRNLAVRAPDGAWRPPHRDGAAWTDEACAQGCDVRYDVDLDALAVACDGEVSCAVRAGDTVLSPALAWLLHPQPKGDAPVTLRVRTEAPDAFATGLRPSVDRPGTYAFRSPELDEGSFTAFGPMRRARVDLGDAHIDVRILGTLAIPDASLHAWIADAARCVSALYGRFPVQATTLFVVPAPGEDDVVFGKVLSLAGASVVLEVGTAMTADRTRDDWVLVHELFHLGFPSFRGEGRWLGEGLATYYEPILRARRGWIDERRVWSEFAEKMPRALATNGTSAPLVRRDDLDAIYWGGALFALASDVGIRRATGGARALDDVLRAALERGGDATHVWKLADVLRLGDTVTGTGVLEAMYGAHAEREAPIDLEALLSSLGVERHEGGVVLRDDAALAPIRRAITRRE